MNTWMMGKKTNQIQDEWITSRNGISLNLWFALISHLIGRSWHNEHSKIILSVHGFISHMLIIALRNNTVCFGVFMPGSPQTEPAWLSRPVWLIGLLRSSNTGNIFVQGSFLATMLCCKLRLLVARITTSAHNKFSCCKKWKQQICCAKRC